MLETTKEAEDQVRALQDMHTMMAQSQEMDMLNSNLEDIDFGLGEVEEATRSVEKGFVFLREDLGLTADEIKEIRNQFDELMGQFNDIVSDAFDLDLALLKVKDMFVELGEAIVGLNDEEKTQLERQIDLIQASKNLADSVVDTIEAFDDLADPAVTTFLEDMIGDLDNLKGTMPDEEFQRLVDVLFNLQNQVDTLNNLELMIDAGINFSGVPPELMQLMGGATPTPELLSATAGLFGSMAGFAGFAEGGLVKGPMLGLVGEAGPELIVPLDRLGNMGGTTNVTINMPVGVSGEDVVRELERYTRQEGNLQLPVSSTVRR
jgi:flagellar biosynthesis regulator FlaF